jgi:hypothetical protein
MDQFLIGEILIEEGYCADVYSKPSELVLVHKSSLVILGLELHFYCYLVSQNLWVISCIFLHPLSPEDMPIKIQVTGSAIL